VERHQFARAVGLIDHFLSGLRALPMPWRNAPLGLCLSGGTDSCALAIAASRCLCADPGAFPGGMTAYHARHALRGSESAGDAASVRELCGKLGLALTEVDAAVESGPGLEARARQRRYDAIRSAAGPGTLLVTAHHRDDQTETVLLRLLRGAGPIGLRGIHALRPDGVWRPFLAAPRESLAKFCRESDWLPRQDSSNHDTTFARNALRHDLVPALEGELPGFSERVAALAVSAQRLEPLLDRALSRLADSIRLAIDQRGFSCDLSEHQAPADDPELELLLDRTWTKIGRRPWAAQQRHRLLVDVASGRSGRRPGGQGELAIWGARKLRVEKR